jgi:hypothetical protein
MVQQLSKTFQDFDGEFSLGQAIAFRQIVQDWMDNLPKIYSTENPDTKWDDGHWYIVWQRRNLHVIGYSTMLHPLKPYLLKKARKSLHDGGSQLTAMAVQCSSLLISALERFFEWTFPDRVKYHFFLFCVFDSATLLCSAIMKDEDVSLPRRDLLVKAIESSLEMLKRLGTVNKHGIRPYAVLASLADKLTLTPEERALQLSCRNPDSPQNLQKHESPPEILQLPANGLFLPAPIPEPLDSQSPVVPVVDCNIPLSQPQVHESPKAHGTGFNEQHVPTTTELSSGSLVTNIVSLTGSIRSDGSGDEEVEEVVREHGVSY